MARKKRKDDLIKEEMRDEDFEYQTGEKGGRGQMGKDNIGEGESEPFTPSDTDDMGEDMI